MPSFATTSLLSSTLAPFLYPCLDSAWLATSLSLRNVARRRRPHKRPQTIIRCQSTSAQTTEPAVDVSQYDHLTPTPPAFTSQPFSDACTLTLQAGAGGHGCISFLREKYIERGPPNGGDGGTGGSVYIQAVRGETSLHKLARRPIIKAARGGNGQGGTMGGRRGEDVVVVVPVGTVVRETWRHDPSEDDDASTRQRGYGSDLEHDNDGEAGPDQSRKWRRDKWLLYPGTLPKYFTSADFPALPRPRKSNLAASQPPAPLRLDLDKPMETPMLLAAGAMGGLGNPHFTTKSVPRPKYATKGEDAMKLQVQLELKLLADVGLVGLPNAGKSTLLRALTRSRTKVGNWAFTTLSPNVGTVVLDSYHGRPSLSGEKKNSEARTHFTIADIPGLIEGAHLDRGLGLGFLRHIERAAVLAFVVDLSAGDAITALQALWKEVGEYEKLREHELNAETEQAAQGEEGVVRFEPFRSSISPTLDPEHDDDTEDVDVVLDPQAGRALPPLSFPPISSKPWFVVATKADLPGTQENFLTLQQYLQQLQTGEEVHPSGKDNAWRKKMYAVPASAINKEGVESIPKIVLDLLDG